MLNQINMNQYKTNNTYTSNESSEKKNEMENEKLGLSISVVDKNDTVNKALYHNYYINSNGMFNNYISIQISTYIHWWTHG